MAAFNEVLRPEEETCPRCDSRIQRTVQFKYGDAWQHHYIVGDKIDWGRNDIGEPGHKLVVVAGYPGECPICAHIPDSTYDVTIREDVIEGVSPSDGTYDYVGDNTYFVVEP